MKNERSPPTSRRLLWMTGLASALSTVSAYANSPFVNNRAPLSEAVRLRPSVLIDPKQVLPSSSQPSAALDRTGERKARVTYSLGLGKNPPVGASSSFQNKSHQSIDEAVQYWNEHESTRPFPKPERPVAFAPKMRTSHSIVPIRLSGDDILTIEGKEQVVGRGHTREWDLNTPWVEMLIHEQQLKLAVN